MILKKGIPDPTHSRKYKSPWSGSFLHFKTSCAFVLYTRCRNKKHKHALQ